MTKNLLKPAPCGITANLLDTAASPRCRKQLLVPMNLWKAIFGGLVALFVTFNFAYRVGGDGVEVQGRNISFQRGHDVQLYRVDDRNAVMVGRSDLNADELAIVRTTTVPFPFSVLCGRFDRDGFTEEYEQVRRSASLAGRVVTRKPHPTPGERDRVLVAMKANEAHAKLAPLATCNESCVTFNAAFLLLFALALVALPVLLLRGTRHDG